MRWPLAETRDSIWGNDRSGGCVQTTDAERSHVLTRLSLDRESVSCGCAVAVVETVAGQSRWWIVVYDAETAMLPVPGSVVDLYAATREGRRLAGRVRIECSVNTLRFAALRGAGPLLLGPAIGPQKQEPGRSHSGGVSRSTPSSGIEEGHCDAQSGTVGDSTRL